MSPRKMGRYSVGLAMIALSLSGCSRTPAQSDYVQYVEQEQQQISPWLQDAEASKQHHLTDLIVSEQLNLLLQQAFRHNPSLQQTWVTLQIRQTQLQQTNAARLPQVNADLGANRIERQHETFSTTVDVNWQVDLWGKLRSDSAAASKDIEEQQRLYQASRDSLAAEIMMAWLNLTATQHAIEIETARLSTLERNEQYILQRYRNGIGTLEDLDNARTSSARSRASLEANQENARQQQRDIKQLIGETGLPDVSVAETYPTVKLALADLPDQTLSRRPDLQAAYAAIEANHLRADVAFKELLPSISIGAALSDAGDTPHQALLASPLWTLLGQLTAPIFQGGRLRASAEQAELETALSYQQYRETLLLAVNEIEQGLSIERTLTIQQQHIEAALASARNSLAQYELSYRTGLVDILDLLVIQQQTYDLEAQLDNLIFQRLSNRISLGLALGLGAPQS